MPINHSIIELNSDYPIMVTDPSNENDAYLRKINIAVQNLDSKHYVFLGGEGLSNSSYGVRLDPAEIFTIELSSVDELYAMSDTDTLDISVLKVYGE